MKTILMAVAVVAVASVIGHESRPVASAQTGATQWAGEWLMAGKADQPCAIFQQGTVLLIVNENGDVATARVDTPGKLHVLHGVRWEAGITAELRDGGRSLAWRDGSVWTRR